MMLPVFCFNVKKLTNAVFSLTKQWSFSKIKLKSRNELNPRSTLERCPSVLVDFKLNHVFRISWKSTFKTIVECFAI